MSLIKAEKDIQSFQAIIISITESEKEDGVKMSSMKEDQDSVNYHKIMIKSKEMKAFVQLQSKITQNLKT